jgi:raffinose/stachyose/melibiose transport system permease protein
MEKPTSTFFRVLAAHAALLTYSLLALFPVLLIILNSFKDRLTIFATPFTLKNSGTFTLYGYQKLFITSPFDFFLLNNFLVTGLADPDPVCQLDGGVRSGRI